MRLDTNNFFAIYAHTKSDGNIPGGSVTNGLSVWWGTSGGLIVTEAENVLTTGSWYNVTITYDGSQSAANRFNIYVNGTDVTGSSTTSGTIGNISTTDIRIGSTEPWGEYFNGQIDEVRIYDTALNSSEVQDIYNDTGSASLNGVYVDTTGAGNFSASNQIAAFDGYTAADDAATMLANGNLII